MPTTPKKLELDTLSPKPLKTNTDPPNDARKDLKISPYGFFGCRPSFLQILNNTGCIVFFISIAHCLQNATNGILGVTISTLEKRFSYSSLESSLMASFYEAGQVPAVILVMFFGSRVHRPKWMGAGMLLVLVGCLIMVLPKVLSGTYEPSSSNSNVTTEDHYTCQSASNYRNDCPANNSSTVALSSFNYLPYFVLGRTLIGVGCTPILTIGLTFINDCTNSHSFALYSGIYNAMSIIGPGLGLVFASFFLTLYEDGAAEAARLKRTMSDADWVGNWWLSYLFVSALIFLTVFPLFGYPDKKDEKESNKEESVVGADPMPEKKDLLDEDKGLKINNQEVASEKKTPVELLTSPLRTVYRLFFNGTFLLACLFNAADMFIVMGFNAFGPKVFENFLALSPTSAGLLFGAVLLPAGAIGTILGGVLIKRFRMTTWDIIRLQTLLAIVVLFCLPVILLNCPDNNFAGVNVGHAHETNFSVNSACTNACGCQHVPYEPVCSAGKTQYFSACHAGCKTKFYNISAQHYVFSDCVCLLSHNTSQVSIGTGGDAVSGACERNFCTLAYLFLPLFAIVVLIVFTCVTMNTTIIFWSVSVHQSTAAVSIQVLVTKLLGSIPGPIMFGIAFDRSCGLYNNNKCSDSSDQCLFVKTATASRNVLLLCTCVKLVNTCAMFLMIFLKKRRDRMEVKKPENAIHS